MTQTQKQTNQIVLTLKMNKFVQTAPKMLAAIKGCFTKHNVSELWDKLIYLSADGASGNSGKDSGLIEQIKEEHGWVLFVWCFSHCLELVKKEH